MANVNNMEINKEAYALINELHEQVTGEKSIAPVNTNEFVSMANTILHAGREQVLNALSIVVSRLIVSVRPYTSKFRGIEVDADRFGGIRRKVKFIDREGIEDENYPLTDGVAVNQQEVRKHQALELQYVGMNTMSDGWTIYDWQLDQCFLNESEFLRFIQGMITNIESKHEQWKESFARTSLNNFIGAKYVADTSNVRHLLTEYNQASGQSLTKEDLLKGTNFKAFIEWLNAEIETTADFMSERSIKYQMNITGKEVAQHTPKDRLKVFLLNKFKNQIDSIVMPNEYHDSYLTLSDFEGVSYWQAIDNPDEVQVKPVYIDSTGATVTSENDVKIADLIGVMFDEEACAIAVQGETVLPSPYNARGQYQNYWYHLRLQMLNDLTEKAVLLVLD